MNEKKSLRAEMLRKINGLTKNEVDLLSKSLNEQLMALIHLKKIKVLHTYLPMNNEVDISPTIKYALSKGIKVVAPKTLKNRKLQHLVLSDLNTLKVGICETLYPSGGNIYEGNYDMIIVPGVAFDRNGRRLGYGAGYYDTFLPEHPTTCKISICYPFQVVKEIPQEAHDVCIDELIF